jgi:hypothetical protein
LKTNRLIYVLALVAVSGASYAQWYNGDFDGRNGGNISNNPGFQSNIYDDFNVGGPGWMVTGVFGNVLTQQGGDFTALNWEIRSGVSVGSGGTLVASGTGAPTNTLTGGSGFGYTEYKVRVTGLNVNLAPGTYWLGLGVVSASGVNNQFMSTTSGANAIGTPPGNNGNSFWNSSSFGFNWVDVQTVLGAGTWDFSMGVEANPVPEPASLIALGTGIAAIVARRRRKIAKA